MKLQHAAYRCYLDMGEYIPVTYDWEMGCWSSGWLDGKWHDLLDHDKPECGFTTDHLAEMVGKVAGRKVRRVVAW